MSYNVTIDSDSNVSISLTSQAFQVTVSQLGEVSGGDMLIATYDPQDISADAFARANHTGTQALSTISDAGTAAAADTGDFLASTALGSTVAELVSGTVPAAQLPSFVDDVEEYNDLASFPATGEQGKIYINLAEGDVYRWSGSAYVQINDAVSSADQATKLATARTIALGGDASGSASFDGSANVTIAVEVADDSHNHVVANVDGLQGALDGKVDDAQVLTNVPLGAVFTDTTYTVGNGGLTEINFTTTRRDTLASATQPGYDISTLTNDAGYTTNVGDITGVTAGTGLSGGGSSGAVTVSISTATQNSLNSADNAMPASGGTFTGDVTIKALLETEHTSSSTSYALDPTTNGTRTTLTLTDTTTLSDSMSDGESMTLRVLNGDTETLNFVSGTLWVGGDVPTLTGDDLIRFEKWDTDLIGYVGLGIA